LAELDPERVRGMAWSPIELEFDEVIVRAVIPF
jgi:hypothetical protein